MQTTRQTLVLELSLSSRCPCAQAPFDPRAETKPLFFTSLGRACPFPRPGEVSSQQTISSSSLRLGVNPAGYLKPSSSLTRTSKPPCHRPLAQHWSHGGPVADSSLAPPRLRPDSSVILLPLASGSQEGPLNVPRVNQLHPEHPVPFPPSSVPGFHSERYPSPTPWEQKPVRRQPGLSGGSKDRGDLIPSHWSKTPGFWESIEE